MRTEAEEFSAVGGLPAHVYVQQDLILDRNCRGLVLNVPTPSSRFFAVQNAERFREQFQRRKRMFVCVERRGPDTPNFRTVRAIDGNVLVLAEPLNYNPQAGAVVDLVLGYRRKFIDEKLGDKLNKEAKQNVWI